MILQNALTMQAPEQHPRVDPVNNELSQDEQWTCLGVADGCWYELRNGIWYRRRPDRLPTL